MLNKLKKKLIQIVETYLSVSKLYVGGYLLNLFGLQVLRSIFKNLIFKLSLYNPKVDDLSISDELERNGIVIIKNFMPHEDFISIKSCLENEETKKLFTYSKNYSKTNVDWLHGKIYKNHIKTKKIYEILNNNFKKYLPYIETVLKQKIRNEVQFNYQFLSLPLGKKDINDSNANIHPDKFFPCIKAFISMKDCTKLEEGPFFYMKKSHKWNLNRIKNEYINSVWYFKSKKINNHSDDKPFKRKLDYLENLSEEPIFCEENSLIITNNMGWHKRGRLAEGQHRKFIRVLFYNDQLSFHKRIIKNLLIKKIEKQKINSLNNKDSQAR